ncbi:MAG: glycoside hydrolase family 2 TIM barrel-domain containing protein [Candidatus Acidiferrum sp.]
MFCNSALPSVRLRNLHNQTGRIACFIGLALCMLIPTSRNAALSADEATALPSTVLAAVDHRHTVSLDGAWYVIVDPYGNGLYDSNGKARSTGFARKLAQTDSTGPIEYNFAKSPTLQVPGDWNTQRESLMFYEGPLWYEKNFAYHKTPGRRVFLHIGAANYRSYLWINGQAICEHEGGFTGFDCEITQALRDGNNFAVIAVDSTRLADGVPTLKTDWWNYGGLTREVSLVEVPDRYIDEFDLHLKRGTTDEIEGWVHVVGATTGSEIKVTLEKEGRSTGITAKTEQDGKAQIHLVDANLQLWAPEHPVLYRVILTAGEDQLEDEMGFRTIETRGTQILLNGQPIFLKGISVHAEAPYRTGRAFSEQDAETLLGWVHELRGNYVRLAHYPHSERMTRLADRMGILVWSEIPVYWECHFEDPVVLSKAKSQLSEMIRRDRDKASVILWSVANETPATPPRTAFLTTLARDVHQLDPSRLVTAALLVGTEGNTKIVDDPLGDVLDVLGTNEYVGWYEHTAADADHTQWDIRYQKPLIMSEFGGGAKAGLHGDVSTRWTEEFQANIYEHQFVMLNQIPQLRGMSPWLLMDFRSPLRLLPEIQDFYNRKGLISQDGHKKKVFFVLQKAYKENAIGHAK